MQPGRGQANASDVEWGAIVGVATWRSDLGDPRRSETLPGASPRDLARLRLYPAARLISRLSGRTLAGGLLRTDACGQATVSSTSKVPTR